MKYGTMAESDDPVDYIVTRVAVMAAVLSLASCGFHALPRNNNPAQQQVDAIVKSLEASQIENVEILHVTSDTESPVPFTPETLEQNYSDKVEIRFARSTPLQDQLIRVMRSVVVQPHERMSDLRWGVVFYMADDQRVGAIYLDRWGGDGAVGDTWVSASGDLFSWLNRTFPSGLR